MISLVHVVGSLPRALGAEGGMAMKKEILNEQLEPLMSPDYRPDGRGQLIHTIVVIAEFRKISFGLIIDD
jgi:hypothetical protein